jgi:hypothetical protein
MKDEFCGKASGKKRGLTMTVKMEKQLTNVDKIQSSIERDLILFSVVPHYYSTYKLASLVDVSCYLVKLF